jgi:phosphoserine phosphatase RsbU/P
MSQGLAVSNPKTQPLALQEEFSAGASRPAKGRASQRIFDPDARAALLLAGHAETASDSPNESVLDTLLLKDLEDAKEVHRSFFPRQNLPIPGLACQTFNRPARYLGGDFYDFLPLQAGRWGFAIGDVCGKGIGAALLMASLQASLRAQAMHAHSDLSTLVSDVDRMVLAASPRHLYASLFYAEYDVATHELLYVNAGQNPPMVLRRKNEHCEVFYLESNGMPIGLFEGSEFFSNTFQLEEGDVLVMYTDGITDSESPSGEQWGRERFQSLLQACRDSTPNQIVRRVLEDISAFVRDSSQNDDMTLVVVAVENGNLIAPSTVNEGVRSLPLS